ncbi:MAG: bifunctional 4-hydroxy-3-methylbut-2-enyl diphosphate reductase/30S ribosomal protein S1 [Clostridia bacterium]|nr:bifunctional 4-hydroxy-3-methylbut-2-enyl diphosphate reductase/30S ribosomal protein S1 [Clostridia bacterium]
MSKREIVVASSAGFCFGVDRAVRLLEEELAKGEVLTLGPIIHNPPFLAELEGRGMRMITSPQQAEAGQTVVLRAHGVPQEVWKQLEAQGVRVVDATCPYVRKIQQIALENTADGKALLVIGNAEHPEIKGVLSYAKGPAYTADGAQQVCQCLCEHPELRQDPFVVVAQTTNDIEEWKKICEILKKECTNAIIFDTICNTTDRRQREAKQLAESCDVCVVVGGRGSANTARLYEICRQASPQGAYWVETAQQLPAFGPHVRTVGVTAGASTPAQIMKEVIMTMSEEKLVQEQADVEEMSFAEALEKSFKTISNGDTVTCVVTGVTPAEVNVDLGTKHACYIPVDDFDIPQGQTIYDVVKVGDELTTVVVRVNDVEGTAQLSKRRAERYRFWEEIETAVENKTVFSANVTEVNRGGVVVNYNGVRIFIPAFQTNVPREKMEELKGQKVEFRITEVQRPKRRVIGSIRAVAMDARREAEEKFWATAEVGQVCQGRVKSFTNYGAFVDVGGVDGMVHVSELSWGHVPHPSKVLEIGQEVEVFIKALDAEKKRVSLGYRKEEDNPWTKFMAANAVDDVIDVKIMRIVPFGAFAEIIPGVDGLIHISRMAKHRVNRAEDVVNVGDVVKVKIVEIDEENKKVGLSIRALLGDEAPAEEAAQDAE